MKKCTTMCGEGACERKTYGNELHLCESECIPYFGVSGGGTGGARSLPIAAGYLQKMGSPLWKKRLGGNDRWGTRKLEHSLRFSWIERKKAIS